MKRRLLDLHLYLGLLCAPYLVVYDVLRGLHGMHEIKGAWLGTVS